MPNNFIKTRAKITTGYLTDKSVTNRITNTINRNEARFYSESIETVKKLIREAIINSLVYKGLNGDFPNIQGNDLQAEFGISDPKPALEKMTQILLDTVKQSQQNRENIQGGRGAKVSLGIVWLKPEDYEEQLMNDPEFRVQSQRLKSISKSKKRKKVIRNFEDSYIIEWMRILLDGGPSAPEKYIPDIQNYGITYDIKNFEARTISRSGRALMTKRPERTTRSVLGSRGNVKLGKLKANLPAHLINVLVNFPYTMPRLAIPKAGRKNFIDEIARNAILYSQIRTALDRIAKKYFKP